MRTKFKNVASLLFIVLFASCSREGIVENGETDNGKIAVATEVSVDGVELTTRAASEAGYTTGDGLYDKGDDVTVAAHANDGYELTAFYDKKHPSTNLGASHKLTVAIPQIFKAEFRKKSFTITVNASPIDGGTVTGGGSYNKGATCTLTATPNNGYTFDGWYEGSTKVSTSSSYNFTVSSNRTMTAQFRSALRNFIAVGDGQIMYYENGKASVVQVGSTKWNSITYGGGKYVAVGGSGMIAYSIDGKNWNETATGALNLRGVTYANNKFVSVGWTKLAYSFDGVNWSTTNIGSNTYNDLNSVTYGNGKFVAVGGNSAYSQKSFAYSSDGVNWNEIDLRASMYSVTYGNGKFVSVGNSYCFYSTNGMNWNEVNLIGTYQSIIYGNGKFVAVGDNGKVAYSSDGINWFSIILMNGWKNWDFYAVTYIGDQFVAIGSEGNIAYSSDGISWDTIKGGVNTTYHGIFAVQ